MGFFNALHKIGIDPEPDTGLGTDVAHNRPVARNGAVPAGQILMQGAVPVPPDLETAATGLDRLAKSGGQGKDWRHSPQELFVLLGVSQGSGELEEAAKSLGCPDSVLEDQARSE